MAVEQLIKMDIESFNRICNELTEAMGFRIQSSVYRVDLVVINAILYIPGEQRYILIFYRKEVIDKSELLDLVSLDNPEIKWIVATTGDFDEEALKFGSEHNLVLIDKTGMDKVLADYGIKIQWERPEKEAEIQKGAFLPSQAELENNLQWARDFLNSKNYDKALEYIDVAFKIKETKDAWLLRGKVYQQMAKPQDSANAYLKGLELNDKDPELWYSLGTVLGELKKDEDAVKAYNQAIELDQNCIPAWMEKGSLMQKKGKYDEALLCFNSVININKNVAEAWNNKGVVLRAMGKLEEALKCYDIAYELDKKFYEPIINKAILLYDLKRYEAAENELYLYLDKNPKDLNALSLLAHSNYLRGFKKDAVERFKKILLENPTDEDVKNMIAKIEEELKPPVSTIPGPVTAHAEVVKEMKAAITKEDPRLIFAEALNFYQNGDLENALLKSDTLLKLDPAHAGAKMLKAQIEEELKKSKS